jgi:hypothetical protein
MAIEVIGAVGLLWRAAQGRTACPIQEESDAEKRALYVVAITFFLLAACITYESVSGLLRHQEPLTSPVGIALSVLSLVLMPVLAYARHRQADGQPCTGCELKRDLGCAPICQWRCSSVCGYALFDWWRADSVGALVMLPVIAWQGWETLTEAASTTLKSTDPIISTGAKR